MEKNNNFAAFYENSYSADLTKGFSSVAGRAANDLNGITEFLKSISGRSPEEQAKMIERCTDSLQSVISRLHRASYFCNTITRHNVMLTRINVGDYVEQFTEKCGAALNDQIKFDLKIRNDFQFISDSRLIDLLLLGFIRRTCCASVNSDLADRPVVNVEITAEIVGNTPELSLFTETVTPQKNCGDMGDIDFFDNYFNEMIYVISDKINSDIEANITADTNHITLRFDNNNQKNLDIRQKIRGMLHDNNNIFSVMLNDLV